MWNEEMGLDNVENDEERSNSSPTRFPKVLGIVWGQNGPQKRRFRRDLEVMNQWTWWLKDKKGANARSRARFLRGAGKGRSAFTTP